MLVTSGKKFCSKVSTLRSELASAIAPIKRALQHLTASASLRYDIRYTMATPLLTKKGLRAPFSFSASTGSNLAKMPIHASSICLLHWVSISSARLKTCSANWSSSIYQKTKVVISAPFLRNQMLLTFDSMSSLKASPASTC